MMSHTASSTGVGNQFELSQPLLDHGCECLSGKFQRETQGINPVVSRLNGS